MASLTAYAQNKVGDSLFRGQAFTPPTTWYFGLHVTQGTWTATTAYTLGQYIAPTTSNGRIYKVTTAGTSGASQPTWPTTAAGTVTDGTVTWTEQTTAMIGGTFPTEVTGGSYARGSAAASLANFAGSQGAGTTVASTGQAGFTTSNNAAISNFPAPTANWGTVGVLTWADAQSVTLAAAITSTSQTSLSLSAALTVGASSLVQVNQELMTVTAGSGTTTLTVTRAAQGTTAQASAAIGTTVSGAIWSFEVLTNPQTINNGNAAPTAAIAAFSNGFNNTL